MPMLGLIGLAAVASLWPGAAEDAARGLAARDDAQRLRAVLEVARQGDGRAVASLVPALADRDPNVRLAAGRLLARRGAPEATRAATKWLADPGPRERLLGLLVLRDAPDLPDEARRAVERALRTGDLSTRLQGLELLAAHPAASSFGALVALLDDELAEVRVRSLRALAALGDPRASLAVVRRLADADRGIRVEAATTLGALHDRRVVPALLRLLEDLTSDPRAPAVDALGRLGDPSAIPALARLGRRSPRDDLARHAALALGAIGTPEAVEALLALAQPPGADDLPVALARAGPAAVPRLCREVGAATSTRARLAAAALGELGDRRATGALVAAVERGAAVTVTALEALARLADPAALPALALVATDGAVPELRLLALDAMEATGDARALVVLPRALRDGAPAVRARAARLAGALGGSPEAAPLAASLADGDGEVRREAARALARLPSLPDEVTRPLVAALARAEAAPLSGATCDDLGAALERSVTAADGPGLARALLTTKVPDARAALTRGLTAAFADRSITDAAAVEVLLRDAGAGGEGALVAADGLSRARLSRDGEARLVGLAAVAEDAVRARLAPALSRFSAGASLLARTLADEGAAASVRAAAAWALAADSDARAELRRATASSEPAVAANARAALASGHARTRWSAVALTTSDGAPEAGRWVVMSAGDGAPVWALTDLRGRARVDGLPDGPLSLSLAPR